MFFLNFVDIKAGSLEETVPELKSKYEYSSQEEHGEFWSVFLVLSFLQCRHCLISFKFHILSSTKQVRDSLGVIGNEVFSFILSLYSILLLLRPAVLLTNNSLYILSNISAVTHRMGGKHQHLQYSGTEQLKETEGESGCTQTSTISLRVSRLHTLLLLELRLLWGLRLLHRRVKERIES